MEIFISWSGGRSKACAEALRDWLPLLMQKVTPWVSSRDIEKGSRFSIQIADRLEKAKFGIACLTPGNKRSEWIHFEAGALTKEVKEAALYTFLLDLKPTDVEPPLATFQHTVGADQHDVLAMVKAINGRLEEPVSEANLDKLFTALWPSLEAKLKALPEEDSSTAGERKDRDLLEEILTTVRNLSKPTATVRSSAEQRRSIITRLVAEAIGEGWPGSVEVFRRRDGGFFVLAEGDNMDLQFTLPVDASYEEAVALIRAKVEEVAKSTSAESLMD
jgi:hypothetical protein